MGYIIDPWMELEWEWGTLNILHIGLAYMHKPPVSIPRAHHDGEFLLINGEHSLQIGILIGRIIIRYNY